MARRSGCTTCAPGSAATGTSIRADYDSGSYTVIELARKYHLSDRQISNILGRPDDRQLHLFGEAK